MWCRNAGGALAGDWHWACDPPPKAHPRRRLVHVDLTSSPSRRCLFTFLSRRLCPGTLSYNTLQILYIMSSSPNNTADPNGNGDEKPRLTEEEKKQNHIASGKLSACAPAWRLYPRHCRRRRRRTPDRRSARLVPCLGRQMADPRTQSKSADRPFAKASTD